MANEETVECPYVVMRNYAGFVLCGQRFSKGEQCPKKQDYCGEIDIEGERVLNICPVDGRIPSDIGLEQKTESA